jgi:hypothetical protein
LDEVDKQRALFNLAVLHFEAGQYKEARMLLTSAVAQYPDLKIRAEDIDQELKEKGF